MKKAYIGDETGKARLFYSSEYQWKRYTIKYTPNETTLVSCNGTYPAPEIYFYTTYPYYEVITSQSSGGGGPSGVSRYTVIIGTYENGSVNGYTLEMYGGGGGRVISGDNYFQFVTFNNIIIHADNGCRLNCTGISGGGGYNATMYGNGYVTTFSRVTTTTSQGTYVDTVTSDNENAYPKNGKSGNYWYVLQPE